MSSMPEKSEVAKQEEATLAFWNKEKIFEQSLTKDAPNGEYVFYDGPPFATGLPHYGHIVGSVIKDVIPRYWTMRGYRVPRTWGWDCHGLPIENIVEKELGFKHKKDIEKMGVAKFNQMCRERVLEYAAEWEKIIPRIGRWADMKNPYRTMDKAFMESVWWVFKSIYDQGLVYEDYRVMHICPRCETTLSQQEVSEGYHDVKDISVTVKFKVKNPEKHGLPENTYFLAWTTTPWTLPGTVALAVGKDINYVAVEIEANNSELSLKKGDVYILAGSVDTFAHAFGSPLGRGIVELHNGDFSWGSATYKGKNILFKNIKDFSWQDLVGIEYEPPFDYYIKDTTLKNHENGWKVYVADFITADSGTGIAHEAPAFGAEDWDLSKQYDLPFVQHVNIDGTMKKEVTDFAGRGVKSKSDDDSVRLATDISVLKYLQEHGTFFSKENITHSYPHCWRCDTPLLNYATSSWFVSVTKIKDTLLETAKDISWSPKHVKEGRFGKWLEGARDWSISRQRFWASAIPMWRCDECKTIRVFGSATELEEASGKKIDDLHKDVVDEIVVPCVCGKKMHRIPDVLDTWFDSGSMPYASRHYPFENKEEFENTFPAQFIGEGQDQTRAWFYYLHVLGGALFKKNAFENVIVNGIVVAEDGKKMAKKLQNYPDPMLLVDKHGADAMRLYLLSSSVVEAENLAFSEAGVDEMAKKNISRLSNVLSFYQLYKNETPATDTSENILDRWILGRLNQLLKESTDGYDAYELDSATRPLALFIDDLSVWYLRRSRNRMKEEGADKTAALGTLRFVLRELSKIMAPATPFLAEEIFQAVRTTDDVQSVHLAEWPTLKTNTDTYEQGGALFSDMNLVRELSSSALMLRQHQGIKVRQPLTTFRALIIPNTTDLVDILKDEINVKEVSEGELGFDWSLTPELVKEGDEREMASAVAQARKTEGFSPRDRAHPNLSPGGKYSATLSTGEVHFDLIRDAT